MKKQFVRVFQGVFPRDFLSLIIETFHPKKWPDGYQEYPVFRTTEFYELVSSKFSSIRKIWQGQATSLFMKMFKLKLTRRSQGNFLVVSPETISRITEIESCLKKDQDLFWDGHNFYPFTKEDREAMERFTAIKLSTNITTVIQEKSAEKIPAELAENTNESLSITDLALQLEEEESR